MAPMASLGQLMPSKVMDLLVHAKPLGAGDLAVGLFLKHVSLRLGPFPEVVHLKPSKPFAVVQSVNPSRFGEIDFKSSQN
jgi:hypothetical protein